MIFSTILTTVANNTKVYDTAAGEIRHITVYKVPKTVKHHLILQETTNTNI